MVADASAPSPPPVAPPASRRRSSASSSSVGKESLPSPSPSTTAANRRLPAGRPAVSSGVSIDGRKIEREVETGKSAPSSRLAAGSTAAASTADRAAAGCGPGDGGGDGGCGVGGPLTTGPLSLSVHEELTFGGTEIALHPDLFSSAIGGGTGGERPDGGASGAGSANTAVTSSDGGINAASASSATGGSVLVAGENGATGIRKSGSKPTPGRSCALKPGDLIEIRVWDRSTARSKDGDTYGRSGHLQHPNHNIHPPPPPPPPQPKSVPLSPSPSPSTASNSSGKKATNSTQEAAEAATAATDTAPQPSAIGPSVVVAPSSHESARRTVPSPLTIADRAPPNGVKHEANSTGASNSASAKKSVPPSMSKYELRTSFVMRVTESSLSAIKGTARAQISLLRRMADLYDLSSFDTVTVTKIESAEEESVLQSVSADFVMVTIKDQFISRGEMFHFQNSLLGKLIYEGQRLDSKDGVRGIARELRHRDRTAKSGIVTNETKFTFRSRSARIIWLVQISSEMWDYASPYEASFGSSSGPVCGAEMCQLYFDKFVAFMYRLFEKWKELEVTHSLTVIFFSRTYLHSYQGIATPSHRSASPSAAAFDCNESAIHIDCDGRFYEDHYRVVIENETRADWESIIYRIKKEFVGYPRDVGWHLSRERAAIPSTATQGNLLEALNVTLNLLQLHYMDRDLHRTGNSIVVVSAGCGVFEVDKGLAGITKQRMMDNGIGSDMLSLSLPPLHVAPFFLYKEVGDTTAEEKTGFDDWKTYFEVPHWMHLSFVHYDHDSHLTGKIGGEKAKGMSVPGLVLPGDEQSSTSDARYSQANGGKLSKNESSPSLTKMDKSANLVQHDSSGTSQRDLISWREFEDILEACRPRHRGDSMASMPSPLKSLIRTWKLLHPDEANASSTMSASRRCSDHDDSSQLPEEEFGARNDSAAVTTYAKEGEERIKVEQKSSFDDSDVSNSHKKATSTSEMVSLAEWGSVDFDTLGGGRFRPPLPKLSSVQTMTSMGGSTSIATNDMMDWHGGSDSGSSPSSSFTSNYSFLLGRSADMTLSGSFSNYRRAYGLQIQPSLSTSLEIHTVSPDIGPSNSAAALAMSMSQSDGSASSKSTEGTNPTHSMSTPPKAVDSSIDASIISSDPSPTKSLRDRDPLIDDLRAQMAIYDASVAMCPVERPTKSVPLDLSQHGRERDINTINENSSDGAGQTASGIGAALRNFADSNSPPGLRTTMRSRTAPGVVKKLSPGMMSGRSTSVGRLQTGVQRTLSSSLGATTGPKTAEPPERINLRSSDTAFPRRAKVFPDDETIISGVGALATARDGYREGYTTRLGSHYPAGHLMATGAGGNISAGISYEARTAPMFRKREHIDQRHQATSRVPVQQREASRSGNIKRTPSRKKHHERRSRHTKSGTHHHSRRKPWVLNPFRQQDEEEMLAKRTHNRRRWSHVFPPGEVEFKRHAGPNWKSLCQPAVLPLTTDFHPSDNELNDEEMYEFRHYPVLLDAMDRSYYKNHKELLSDMVMQRIIQDYQLVPQHVVNESNRRGEIERRALVAASNDSVSKRMNLFTSRSRLVSPTPRTLSTDDNVHHTLSLGHNVHKLSYNPVSDAIEVVQYHAKFAQNDSRNTYKYRYLLWMPITNSYQRVVQTFTKFSSEYRWNRLDNLISGDPENALSEDTRYRRIAFGIIPDGFSDAAKEQEYMQKFMRLCDYLSNSRLLHTDSSEKSPPPKDSIEKLGIKRVTSADPRSENHAHSTRRSAGGAKHFILQLRGGTREKYEWLDLVMDGVFDTKRVYRIGVHWLVASGGKVEAQIQLLHRRCSQYGLTLVPFPQHAMSDQLYLHPFIAPSTIVVRDRSKGQAVESSLVEKFNFFPAGISWIDSVEIEGASDFEFALDKRGKIGSIAVRQFVHQTGIVFIRVVEDKRGYLAFCWLRNRLLIGDDEELQALASKLFFDLKEFVSNSTVSSSKLVAQSVAAPSTVPPGVAETSTNTTTVAPADVVAPRPVIIAHEP